MDQDKLEKARSRLVQPMLQQTAHLQFRPEASKLYYKKKKKVVKDSHKHKHWIQCVHFAVKCTYVSIQVACAAFCHHFVSCYQGAEGGGTMIFPFCPDGLRPII